MTLVICLVTVAKLVVKSDPVMWRSQGFMVKLWSQLWGPPVKIAHHQNYEL